MSISEGNLKGSAGMRDRAREEHVEKIEQLKESLRKTNSNKARRDLKKAVFRAEKMLMEYDKWHDN